MEASLWVRKRRRDGIGQFGKRDSVGAGQRRRATATDSDSDRQGRRRRGHSHRQGQAEERVGDCA